MQKVLHFSFICLWGVFSVLLAGCASKSKGPNPSNTLTGATMRQGVDWIDDSQVYSESGLVARDSTSMSVTGYGAGQYDPQDLLAHVYFDFDDDSIRSSERETVQEVIKQLQASKDMKIVAVGHTDWYGTLEYNLVLGDKRSNSVRKFLEKMGIDPMRVETLSMGKLEAVQGLPKNDSRVMADRRVDLIRVHR